MIMKRAIAAALLAAALLFPAPAAAVTPSYGHAYVRACERVNVLPFTCWQLLGPIQFFCQFGRDGNWIAASDKRTPLCALAKGLDA